MERPIGAPVSIPASEPMMTIRDLQPADADAVVEIQAGSPETSQWPKKDYESVGRDGSRGWVVDEAGSVTGFLIARLIADEVEILNFAVDQRMRRRGVGKRLLSEAMAWAGRNGAARAYLEVREGNQSGVEFYRAQGFRAVGMRPNYYFNPPDDAILLAAPVSRQ